MLNVVVDLSHHSTATSFQKAKQNGTIDVIHKATEGRIFVDAKYYAPRALMLENGLSCDTYHFGVRGNSKQLNANT